MKKFVIPAILTAFFIQLFSLCYALEYSEVNTVRPPAYRVGLSDEPEKEYVEAKQTAENTAKKKAAELNTVYAKEDTNEPVKFNANEITYADLSIKQISKEISQELLLDEEETVGDLSLLWQGAATQSDTINFALYKLSNPEEDKPDEKSIKKVLSTIAGMSTIAGAGMGNPVLATGSIIGGNVLGIMSQDTKALNYKYTKVTDADMIILVRKIEDLQQKAVDLYYQYMTARKKLKMIEKMTAERKRIYDKSQESSKEIILITDAYYRTSQDMLIKARAEFLSKRAALEQFVGNEVFVQFEADLAEREK